MTADQVKYLKEQLNKDNGEGKPVANSVFYDFDNNMAFRNGFDFVIFDDANELVHCIAANQNARVKDQSPYCMYSASYEQLQYTEANLDLDGLNHVLANMLKDLVTDDQAAMIKKWALDLPVNPISTVLSSYHKEPNPTIPYRPVTVVTRPDGVSQGYPVTGATEEQPIKAVSADKAVDSIGSLTDGANVVISSKDDTAITEPLTVAANNVTITGKDLPVTGDVKVEGDGVTLKGISFSNDNVTGDYKGSHMLSITGDNATLSGCTFKDDGTASKTRTAITSTAETMLIEDCVFDGAGGIYNAFESTYNVGVVSNMIIRNCTFKKEAASNNFVSLYKFVDGATVLFENCIFEQGNNSNALRLSNLDNTHVTVTFKDCKFSTENTGEYAGLVLLQDPSSDKSEDFSLITINFINLTNMEGKVYKDNNGTGADKIWYTYNTETEPVVNFA